MADGRPPARRTRLVAWIAAAVAIALVVWWMTRRDDAPGPVGAQPAALSPAAVPHPTPRRVGRDAEPPPPATDAPVRTPTAEPSWKPRDVRILVVAADGGAPIEAAEVHVDATVAAFDYVNFEAFDARTDAAGLARFPIIPGRVACLVVRRRGYCLASSEPHTESEELRVELVAGIPLAGRVVDAETRQPVAGVAVRVWDTGRLSGPSDDGELDRTLVTGDDGRFETSGLPASRQVTVVAAKAGFRTQTLVTTPTAASGEVEMLLGDGGVMFGVVFGQDGRPQPGVEVLQVPADWVDLPVPAAPGVRERSAQRMLQTFLFPPVVTDAEGRYEFRGVRLPLRGVPQPRVAVARDADGLTARGEPATFTHQGERMQRDIRFALAPSITVQVRSTKPLPEDAMVRVQHSGGNPEVTKPLPAGGTPVQFDGLTAGIWFVRLSFGSHQSGNEWQRMERLTLAGGEDAKVEMVFDDAVRITGRVVDATGAGLNDVGVMVVSSAADGDANVTAFVSTSKDGAFAVGGLFPQPASVTAGEPETREFNAKVRRDSTLESVTLDDVPPGGAPLVIRLRALGRLSGRVAPVPEKRSLSLCVRAGRVQRHVAMKVADDGAFTCVAPFVDLPMSAWISANGPSPFVLDVAPVAPGETRDVGTIELKPGRALEGRLVDADGAPLANVSVKTLEPWMQLQSPTTDADGRFRLERLPNRPVVVRVDATPNTPVTIVVLAADTASPPTVTIAPGAIVRGRVFDATGAPMARAEISFRPGHDLTDEEGALGWVLADDKGAFALRLQSGRGSVRAHDPVTRKEGAPVELTVADGDEREIELRVP